MSNITLGEFIISKGIEHGLDEKEINVIMTKASHRLPGNVPKEKCEEQVLEWIKKKASEKEATKPAPETNELGPFIIDKGLEYGLSEDEINKVLISASRILPGNVEPKKYKETALEWIQNIAKRKAQSDESPKPNFK